MTGLPAENSGVRPTQGGQDSIFSPSRAAPKQGVVQEYLTPPPGGSNQPTACLACFQPRTPLSPLSASGTGFFCF